MYFSHFELDVKVQGLFRGKRPEWVVKAEYVFSDAEIKKNQNQLDHIVNALNLLLSACKLLSVVEQNIMLQEEKAVDILSLIEDDTTALQSRRYSFTMNRRMSMLSENAMADQRDAAPNLDRELFQSQAYQRVFIYNPTQLWAKGAPEASHNLLRAIWNRDAPIVYSLLQNNADPMACDFEDRSATVLAAQVTQQLDVTTSLLEHGALEIEVVTSKDMTDYQTRVSLSRTLLSLEKRNQ